MAPSAAPRGSQAAGRPGLWRALGCGSLLLSAGFGIAAAQAGEIQATAGALGLGSRVNGTLGGSCGSGPCAISGGTAAGGNLFHRFSSFDSRGAITGVTIDGQGFRHVVLGVIHPLGTFLDKPLSLSGGGQLIWLSPGGIQLGGAYGFTGMAQLTLSTASGLRLGEGSFDALRTPASQAAALSGSLLPAAAGLLRDPASLQSIGLSRSGDLSLSGGLLSVDRNLLLDAQGANVLLQGAQIQAAAIGVQGQNIAQNSSLTAQGPAASVRLEAGGNLLASAPIRAAGSEGKGGAIALQAGGNLMQTVGSHLDASGPAGGGSIVVQAGGQLFSSGRYDARGLQASARGGEIEITAPAVLLRSAQADAAGGAAGGAVRIGGGWQGSALRHGGSLALSIDSNAGTALGADAMARGHGGEVVVWSEGEARFAGSASARGGPQGGDGGAIEISGKGALHFAGRGDASAAAGRAGRLLLDPQTIHIEANAPASGTAYGTFTLADPNPGSSQSFASSVVALANGDIVATDPADDFLARRSGAVYQFNPDGSLVASLYGQSEFDAVGSGGISALTSGDYVVASPAWNRPGGAVSVGAATWRSASSRDSVSVSASNSLVGSSSGDSVASGGILALNQGNYVVVSPSWDLRDSNGALRAADAGAVSWGDGSTGSSVGEVNGGNSRIGTTAQDAVGSGGVTPLADGNYVIASPFWNLSDSSGRVLAAQTGAVTWASGAASSSGPVAASNSLIGGHANDRAASAGVIDLGSSGNYVVLSPEWNLVAPSIGSVLAPAAGAATLVPGAAAFSATITPSNSLTGSSSNDRVGSLAKALANGDFVVGSPRWDGRDGFNNPISDAGAATFSSGSVGAATVGAVSRFNSLVGGNAGDLVSSGGITALGTGNYVVSSPSWNRQEGSTAPLQSLAGAATFGLAGSGVQGEITASNSLIGSRAGDRISSGGVVALSNGGYVVSSPLWDRSDPQGNQLATDAGAASYGDGSTGVRGLVDPFSNSWVGSLSNDQVSSGGITALASGDRYVISSPFWNLADTSGQPRFTAAGAATWSDPGTGSSSAGFGVVSSQNSLVGSGSGDRIASGGVVALSDGNYVVSSPLFDRSDAAGISQDAGAATWGNGLSGTVGFVGAANSLIGSSPNDSVSSGGIHPLRNGYFVVSSPSWDRVDAPGSAPVQDAGAASFGAAGLAGPVALANSLTGRSSGDQYSRTATGSPAVVSLAGSDPAFLVNSSLYNGGDGALTSSGLLQLAFAYPYSPGDPLLPSSGASAGRISASAFNGAAITISPQSIAAIARTGTPVFLQASGDLFLHADSPIDLASSSITPGSLTLEAGRSLSLASSIYSRGADISLRANQAAAAAAGSRPAGAGDLLVQPGVELNAKGSLANGDLELLVGPSRPDLGQTAGLLRLRNSVLQAAAITATGSTGVQIDNSQLQAQQQLTISNTPPSASVLVDAAAPGVSITASQLQADSLVAIGGAPARSSAITGSATGSAAGVRISDGTQITLNGPEARLSIEGKGGRGAAAAGIEILGSSLRLAHASSSTSGISLSGLGGQAASDTSFLAGILLGQGTSLEAGAGAISLTGKGGSSSLPDTSQSFHGGMQLGDVSLSSGSGNIRITARGGSASNGRVDGLVLHSSSGSQPTRIRTAGGSITIDAAAGASSNGSGSGARIGETGGSGAAVELETSAGGSIAITAAGNASPGASSSGNIGLLLGDQARISSSGGIQLSGSGGFGVNGNHGIAAAAGSDIQLRLFSGASGSNQLLLEGFRGIASGDNNHSLQLLGTIRTEATTADPSVPDLVLEGGLAAQGHLAGGTAFSGGSNNIGVFLGGTILSSAADSRVRIEGEAEGVGGGTAAAGGNAGVWIDPAAVLRIGAPPSGLPSASQQAVLAISGSGAPQSAGQANHGVYLAGSLSVGGGLQIRARGGSGSDGNRGFQQASTGTIALTGQLPQTGSYTGLALDIDARSGQTSGDGNQAVLLQGQTDIQSTRDSSIVGTVASGGQNANSGIEIRSDGMFANRFSSLGPLAFRGVGSGLGSGNHGFLSSALLTSAGLEIEGTGGGGIDANSGIAAFALDPASSQASWQISSPALGPALRLSGSGAGSGNDNVGVWLAAPVVVSGGGTSSISGSGGSGVSGNSGVILGSPSSTQSARPIARGLSSDGTISLSGARGDASGSGNRGVEILSPLTSSAAGSGAATISLVGDDLSGTPTRTPNADNVGIWIHGAGSVRAASSSGSIALVGVGRGSGSGNHGIVVSSDGTDTSSGQPLWGVESAGSGTGIRLNGSAAAQGDGQSVLLQGSSLNASAGGDIVVSGSGAPITLQSGRVSIQRPGTLSIHGAPFTWLGGTIAGNGSVDTSPGAQLPGPGERLLDGPIWSLEDATLAAGLLRLASGRLDLTGSFTSLLGSSLRLDGGAELHSTANARLEGRFDVAQGGRVTIQGGRFELRGGGTDAGATYRVEAGSQAGQLIWNADRLLLGSNAYQSANGGLYELASGTLYSPSSLSFAGDLLVSGGKILAGTAASVDPGGPGQPGPRSPGAPASGGDPASGGGGGSGFPAQAGAPLHFSLAGDFTQTGGSISGFDSIRIASPGAVSITSAALSTAPGGSISLASLSPNPAAGVEITAAELNTSGGSGNGGQISIDGAAIRLSRSQLRTSGALSGGIINIGVSPDAPSGPPASVVIQQSELFADPVAKGGQINIYGQTIEVAGSDLNLSGLQGGSFAAGGPGASSLLLDSATVITLSYDAPLDLGVEPGGTLINNARIVRTGAPPPPSPPPPGPCQGSGCNPGGGGTGWQPLLNQPALAVALQQSLNQAPLSTNPRTSTRAMAPPEPLQPRRVVSSGAANANGIRLEISAASFSPEAAMALGSFPTTPPLPADALQPAAQGPIEMMSPREARRRFDGETASTQQETARQLGLAADELSAPPTMEELQKFLGKVTDWMRSQGRQSSCQGGQRPCP